MNCPLHLVAQTRRGCRNHEAVPPRSPPSLGAPGLLAECPAEAQPIRSQTRVVAADAGKPTVVPRTRRCVENDRLDWCGQMSPEGWDASKPVSRCY